MQSNNPVFTRNEAFNGHAAGHQTPYGQQGYGYGQTQTADPYGQYGDPATWGTGAPVQQPSAGRMTIDSVVQKTAMTLGVVVLFAMLTWVGLGQTDAAGNMSTEDFGRLSLATMAGTGIAFVLSLVNSFKKVVSPGLVLAFAAAEGVALGGISKIFDLQFAGSGVVSGAVIGTMAAFAGTLAAYKYFAIKVSDKFRRGVVAGMFAMVGLSLMSLVLSLFGVNIGLFSGGLGAILSVVGLVLGIFMLIMDFDFVEQGIAYGLEERQSWTAAFAMTVSLVWIYTNLLRLLAFFQQD